MKQPERNRLENVLGGLREKYKVVSVDALPNLLAYATAIHDWSSRTQLVSNRDLDVLVDRHIIESLGAPFVYNFKSVSNVIDLGSGAGLPGIPLAVVFPQVKFVLAEPMRKRVLFLKHAISLLGLENVEVFPGRMEEFRFSGNNCVVIARAVASLEKLVRLAAASMQDAFTLLAMKGGELSAEVESARKKYPDLEMQVFRYPERVSPVSSNKKLVVVRRKEVAVGEE